MTCCHGFVQPFLAFCDIDDLSQDLLINELRPIDLFDWSLSFSDLKAGTLPDLALCICHSVFDLIC